MRNEIFARYGYRFSSPRLKEYFGAKEWYSPREDNVDNYLTEIEKYNIALIREAESLSKN